MAIPVLEVSVGPAKAICSSMHTCDGAAGNPFFAESGNSCMSSARNPRLSMQRGSKVRAFEFVQPFGGMKPEMGGYVAAVGKPLLS